jgi:hypothetical protein
MNVGDLVKTTGFGPEGTTGELGIIVKAVRYNERIFIVYFNSGGGVQIQYAADGLVVISENRWLGRGSGQDCISNTLGRYRHTGSTRWR